MPQLILNKFLSQEYHVTNPDGSQLIAWPLRVEAIGIDMPSEVFVYQMVSSEDPVPGDVYSCMASVTQLQELPVGARLPTDGSYQIPFYRRSSMEVFCDHPDDVAKVWEYIQVRAAELVKALKQMDFLYAAEEAVVTPDGTTLQKPMLAPINLSLSYHPAGTAVVGPPQDITPADATIKGWLPISAYTSGDAPNGSRFFYNWEQDANFSAAMDRVNPEKLEDSLQLFYNGLLLPWGRVWKANTKTIFWLDFVTTDIGGLDEANAPADTFGDAPWPTDYIDQENPGSVSPSLKLTVFPAS